MSEPETATEDRSQETAVSTCPQCGSPMTGVCGETCRNCGFHLGCGTEP
ncbi:MAG TPA: hypothetical protein VNM16_01075 [Bacillota bacterium]|nr:hypothetical protein [Bacillota bacterium]